MSDLSDDTESLRADRDRWRSRAEALERRLDRAGKHLERIQRELDERTAQHAELVAQLSARVHGLSEDRAVIMDAYQQTRRDMGQFREALDEMLVDVPADT